MPLCGTRLVVGLDFQTGDQSAYVMDPVTRRQECELQSRVLHLWEDVKGANNLQEHCPRAQRPHVGG